MRFFPKQSCVDIEAIWEQILVDCPTDSIFITPWWQGTWWRRFGTNKRISIELIRFDGDLLGISPLMTQGRVTSFIGDPNVYDYMDFPVIHGKEEGFFEQLWSNLKLMEWDVLHFSSIIENSPTLEFLPYLAKESGYIVKVEEIEKTPFIILPQTWDIYVAELRKKDRHELRRKLRRLNERVAPIQYLVDTSLGVLDNNMEDFFYLMEMSGSEKANFLNDGNREFFRDIARELSKRDQFKLYFMEIEGRKVAGCICFDYGDAYFLYNSGYLPEFSFLSIGLLNKAFTIEDAIAKRKVEYNFLKGDERYKYNLGAQNKIVYDLMIERRHRTFLSS